MFFWRGAGSDSNVQTQPKVNNHVDAGMVSNHTSPALIFTIIQIQLTDIPIYLYIIDDIQTTSEKVQLHFDNETFTRQLDIYKIEKKKAFLKAVEEYANTNKSIYLYNLL